MTARRAMPDPEDRAWDDTMELSAIRRGVDWDLDVDPRAPRRALAEQVPSMDLRPATRAMRAEVRTEPSRAAEPVADTAPVEQERTPEHRQWLSLDHLRRQPLVPIVLLGGLVLALVVGLLPGNTVPTTKLVPLVTQVSLVCPTAEGDLQVVSADGAGHTTTTLGTPGFATVIAPEDRTTTVTGGRLVTADTRTAWAGCGRAQTDQYVQLPGGQGAQLEIINPDAADALIDITLSGPDGEITGPGLRGLTIAATSRTVIDLAEHADTRTALGARVRSSVGRVMAFGRIDRPDLLDVVPATQQGTHLTVAPTPGQVTTRLLLTNPGTTRNAVTLTASSSAGQLALGANARITLDAQRTVAVDIPSENQAVALTLEGRDPFAVTAIAVTEADSGFVIGQSVETVESTQQLVAAVRGAGEVLVANPGEGEALVTIDWGEGQAIASVSVPTQSVVSVAIPEGATRAALDATLPVTATVALRGDGSGLTTHLAQPVPRTTAAMPLEYHPGLGR